MRGWLRRLPWLLFAAAGAAAAWWAEDGGRGRPVPSAGPSGWGAPQEISFGAMSTYGRIRLYPDADLPPDRAQEALAGALGALRRVESLMGPRGPGSDVFRLNQAPAGQWVPVDALTWTVAMEALRFHALTGGAFDPTVGPLKRLYFWPAGPAAAEGAESGDDGAEGAEGADGPAWPSDEEVRQALERVGADHLRFDGESRRLAFARPGMSLDLAALAKGFAVDEAARALREAGVQDALVEAGGELRLLGGVPLPAAEPGEAPEGAPLPPGRRPWNIRIDHPRGGEPVALLPRTACAVATSGDAGRHRTRLGARHSHILDPRTGLPLSRGLVSVTALLPGPCMKADALATALSVLGAEGAERFLGERADDLLAGGAEVWWVAEDDAGGLSVSRLIVPGPGLDATGCQPDWPLPARVWRGPEEGFVP